MIVKQTLPEDSFAKRLPSLVEKASFLKNTMKESFAKVSQRYGRSIVIFRL